MPDLFDSLNIDGLEFRNRIVLPPMQTRLATSDGEVTDGLKDHYFERAGGVGLIIVEHSYVTPEGKYAKNQLGIHKDELVSGLSELADTIHEEGAVTVIQLNHAGAHVDDREVGSQPVSPSGVEGSRRLEKSEIRRIRREFVEAAGRAVEAGFDGVEVHGAHGFLLNQFYSPLTNERDDEYGGSFENRVRFPLEVVEGVREKIGDNLLFYRLGSDDLDPEGTQIEDSQKFAEKLVDEGVDVIDVSGGVCGSRPKELVGKQGFFIPQGEKIKNVVDVPVIGVGGITYPEFARKVIREGRVDLVAVGRAQLADPEWAVKAAEKIKGK